MAWSSISVFEKKCFARRSLSIFGPLNGGLLCPPEYQLGPKFDDREVHIHRIFADVLLDCDEQPKPRKPGHMWRHKSGIYEAVGCWFVIWWGYHNRDSLPFSHNSFLYELTKRKRSKFFQIFTREPSIPFDLSDKDYWRKVAAEIAPFLASRTRPYAPNILLTHSKDVHKLAQYVSQHFEALAAVEMEKNQKRIANNSSTSPPTSSAITSTSTSNSASDSPQLCPPSEQICQDGTVTTASGRKRHCPPQQPASTKTPRNQPFAIAYPLPTHFPANNRSTLAQCSNEEQGNPSSPHSNGFGSQTFSHPNVTYSAAVNVPIPFTSLPMADPIPSSTGTGQQPSTSNAPSSSVYQYYPMQGFIGFHTFEGNTYSLKCALNSASDPSRPACQ